MGRFSANDIENYGNSAKSSFFRLVNNGDTEKVRFMYNGAEDIEGYAVHEIEDSDGRKRYVNCLREYNEPKSKCPFCEANNFQKVKLYLPLYIESTGEVKLWERGKQFYKKLSSLCARYSSADKPFCSHIFEIERQGEAGDQHTTYEPYYISSDNTTLDDLPEAPTVIGTIILDKSEDDMRYYLEHRRFPEGVTNDSESGVRRRTPSGRKEEF